MAWIEIHDTLPDHPKVLKLSAILKMDKDAVVGKLVRLWTWALNNRESGRFTDLDESIISEVMRYKSKPHTLLTALISSGLVDRVEDGYCIHDWFEHVAMLMEKREIKRTQTRERVRKHRERQAEANACNALQERNVTQESNAYNAATIPNHTVNPSPSLPTGSKSKGKKQSGRAYNHSQRHYTNEEMKRIGVNLMDDEGTTH